MNARAGGGWTGRGGFWLRRLALLALVAGALPLVLSLVYIPSFVHPVSTLMMKDLAAFRGYERQWTPIDEMGRRLVHSVMMSEDGQFCSHRGVDMGEMRALIRDALDGAQTRGGSTVTMQTVKNLYLWQGRSYVRKALEIPLAVYFDLVVPKKRIMEIYLNIAEWGPNIYGAEAAARHHFGKSTRDLSAREAALLAVTLPNPAARDPARPSNALTRVARTIERRAGASGAYVGCLA